jgi:hypothetical protein
LAIAGALYALTLSPNLGAAHDGIAYLNQIESGTRLLHPHHLLYGPAAWTWLRAARAVGVRADAAQVVAALSAAAGIATLALFQLGARRLGRSASQAALLSLLPALSFGFWAYSVSVEVYLLPLPFLLAAWILLLAPNPRPGRLAAIGALQGCAMLLHQAHALFGAVVVVALVRSRGPHRARGLALFAGTAAALALAGYGLALLALQPSSPQQARAFLLGYAGDPGFLAPLSLATALRIAVGAGRTLIGAHFVFAQPWLAERVARSLPDQYLEDERYLVAELGGAAAAALLGASALVIGALALLFARGLSRLRAAGEPARRGALLAGVWLLSYSAFFALWVPQNLEFWIPQSLAFWLIFAATPRAPAAIAALALALGAINYQGGIRWLADPARDLHRALVRPFELEATPQDLLVVGRGWILLDYARRFAPCESLALVGVSGRVPDPLGRQAELRTAVEATLARGGRVFVSGEAVHLEPTLARAVGAATAATLEETWDPYRGRWETGAGQAGPYYRIGPRGTPAPD